MARADKTAVGPGDRRHSHALLILDLISDFGFPGGRQLLKPALRAAVQIARLKQRARARRIPCIYVNDNAGHWNTDRAELVGHCLEENSPAADLVRLIEPAPKDFFILKPRHSAFFATPLHTLLNQLAVHTLVVTGVTTHQCVLFTAVDAHMRDFQLIVPQDCVAADTAAHTRTALELFKASLGAATPRGAAVRFTSRRRKRRTAAAN